MMFRRSAVFLLLFIAANTHAQTKNEVPASRVTIDPSRLLQRIDGIGVNANSRSWDGKNLEPALDLLIDSMRFSIWRVIAETSDGWELENDNNDPFTFNWNYYNKLYETPKFQKVWNTVSYLNRRGITDNIVINFMGFAPAWMGTKIIEPKYEDEYVELVVSFYYYALKTKGLKFGLIAPTNESDHHCCSEGPHLSGEQHARILNKIIRRMEDLKIMNNIGIVAPDNASTAKALNEFVPAMLRDTLVMSHITQLGFHSYSGGLAEIRPFISQSPYPGKTFWVTEWNNWCNGCDEGKLGDYNYRFARASVAYLLSLLKNGAGASLLWEAYDSYYSHHAPSLFSYWGVLGYDPDNKKYFPRKHFYAIQQVSRFLQPGSRQVDIKQEGDSVLVFAAIDSSKNQMMLTGVNHLKSPINFSASIQQIAGLKNVSVIFTDSVNNLATIRNVAIDGSTIQLEIPADCLFTITADLSSTRAGKNPEPAGWYAGDIHVHRNCGTDSILPEEQLPGMMEQNDLSVVSILADMGNAEVKPSEADLKKIDGKISSLSSAKRILQWDAEWHWDATYNQFGHQALGGHLVLLGLKEAHQVWEESPWRVLNFAKEQGAVRGFAHFQYLNDSIQTNLNCCIPIDYPVEAALGNVDFVSEDVFSGTRASAGSFDAEAAMHAYYKLLNCGFKIGLAAGTDYPCNGNEPLGSLLTYAKVDGDLTYRKWIDAIRDGRTVVSRNAHREFLDLKVADNIFPGDELKTGSRSRLNIEVKWTANENLSGTIELIYNGKIIDSLSSDLKKGDSVILRTSFLVEKSGWICARRMVNQTHQVHTAPVYIKVNNKPVRGSRKDALYFVGWIDNILNKIKPGGAWSGYFKNDKAVITARYERAKKIYQAIAREATND